QILAASDGLAVTARGFLRSPRGCALSDLIEQTANAVQDQNSELSSVALAIPRPSGKRPLILLLRSVRNVSSEPDIAETVSLLFKSIGLVGTRGLLPVLFEIGLARTRSEGRVMKSRSSFAHRGVHTAI